MDLVLAPYLINIKKLEFQESFRIINEWLNKCDNIRRLDNSTFDYRLKYAITYAARKQYGPIRKEKIETDNRFRTLYMLLKEKAIL